MPAQTLLVDRRWSSHPRNVHLAREAVRLAMREFASVGDVDLFELAVGEACSNAVEHGSPAGEQNEFALRCYVSAEAELVFEVEDEGTEFALSDLPLSCPQDQFSEHGRGLFLMNQIMDRVVLLRTAQGLNVRMSKVLTAPPESACFLAYSG